MLKISALHLILAAFFAGVIAVRADPPAGKTWQPIPELSDEFDGAALDAGKWFDHDPKWKGRPPALFMPGNVAVKDGSLHITARVQEVPGAPKGYHTFTTGFVKSKTLAKYGYFEIEARPMRANVCNGFWFYNVEKDWHTEIDVFEIFGGNAEQANADRMTIHIFRTPTYQGTDTQHLKSGEIFKAPYRFADDFHVFGLEWNETEIRWLVDGEVKRIAKNEHNHQALNLCINAETAPNWFGLPTHESLPATFEIRYVRAWRPVPGTQPAASRPAHASR